MAEAGRAFWVPQSQPCCSRATQSRVPRPTARRLLETSKEETPQPLGSLEVLPEKKDSPLHRTEGFFSLVSVV